MHVAEGRPGAAVGRQAGPVGDVSAGHGADPLPARRDEPLAALGEFGRFSASDSAGRSKSSVTLSGHE